MGRVVSDYTSDHTRWMNEQMAKHPEWADDQKVGRAIWWDKPQTEEEKRAVAASKLPLKPYPYDNSNF